MKQASVPHRPRGAGGRPRNRAKDVAILAAARIVSLESGLSASTMEGIADLAGCSKVTVYKRFRNKSSLFEGVVHEEVAHMSRALREEPGVGGTFVDRLNGIGCFLMAFVLNRDHRTFARMLRQERSHAAALSQSFFETGLAHCRVRMARLLEEAAQAGLITMDDPTLAAADFLALCCGFTETELDLGVIRPLDGAEIRCRVERGTHLFLRVYNGFQ